MKNKIPNIDIVILAIKSGIQQNHNTCISKFNFASLFHYNLLAIYMYVHKIKMKIFLCYFRKYVGLSNFLEEFQCMQLWFFQFLLRFPTYAGLRIRRFNELWILYVQISCSIRKDDQKKNQMLRILCWMLVDCLVNSKWKVWKECFPL